MNRRDAVWQQAMYLVGKPGFIKDIKAVRKKYGFPENGFRSESELEDWREKNIYYKFVDPVDDLDDKIANDIAKIVGKTEYGLSPGWQHAVERFMYLNNVEDMQLPIKLDTRVVKDSQTGKQIIQLTIAEDTDKNDYVEHWNEIEYLREYHGLKSPGRKRQADKFTLRRKKLAYDIWVKTGSYSKAASAVEKEFTKEYESKAYTPDDAKTDVQNFIKQAGI